MKKRIQILFVLFMTVVIFHSCKKDHSQDANNESEIISKVNSWLEKQKPEGKPNKTANVELLKNNLDISGLRVEQSGEDEQLIIIPIKAEYKTEKAIKDNVIPNLVLILNKSGNIRKGNIILYTPESGQSYEKIPDDAFYDIYNTAELKCNGQFKFLSVTGKWLYQLAYKDGKLNSVGLVKPNASPSPANGVGVSSRLSACTDWYLVTTYYDIYHNIISQTSVYIGRTCDGCDDPNLQQICEDPSQGEGGSPNTEYEFEEERVKGADYEWRVQFVPSQFGSGAIYETHRLVGKFYTRNTQNNRFLGGSSSHLDLYGSFWGQNSSVGYSNTSSTVTVNSNTQVNIISSGTIRFIINDVTYNYSGSKTVLLTECSWN